MNQKVTVIIPAYNVENQINSCINSLKLQTYDNIEFIIINDGSTDHTLNLIYDLTKNDNRFIIVNQSNMGVSLARKKGVEMATGNYIGFVDADDIIEPELYERLVSNLNKYNADISHCGYVVISYDKSKIYKYGTGKIIEQDNFKGIKDLLEGTIIEPGLCNKLYRQNLFKDIDYEDLSLIKNNEDLLLNYFLFSKSNKSVFEDVCLYNYILRKDSATMTNINIHNLIDPLKVLCIIEKNTDDSILQKFILERKVRQYIKIATADIKNDPKLIENCKQRKCEFRKLLHNIIVSDYCSYKLKIMAIWASFLPSSYRYVHTIYNKFKYK